MSATGSRLASSICDKAKMLIKKRGHHENSYCIGFVGIDNCVAYLRGAKRIQRDVEAGSAKAKPCSKDRRLVLADGTYNCKSCTPPYEVKADGLDQSITGNPRYNTVSVKIVDDRTVMKTAKKEGKTVAESTVVISADGKTMTETQTISGVLPRPVEMASRSARVAAGPAGSHLVSGEWRLVEADLPNHEEDTTYKVSGNTLTMSDRAGRSFSAKLDGTEAPYSGDPRFTSVSVKLIDSRTIEESDKNQDKIVLITRWTVGPDGTTMHVRFDNTQGFVQEQTGHKIE